MKFTVYVVRLGKLVRPHFCFDGEPYEPSPNAEVLFNLSSDEETNGLVELRQKALKEIQRRGIEVDPEDFMR
jgi:hypothetical protein